MTLYPRGGGTRICARRLLLLLAVLIIGACAAPLITRSAYADDPPAAAENPNHMLGAQMEATTTEDDRRAAKFANDGDAQTWWSSGEEPPAADVTLKGTFPQATKIKQVNVLFEARTYEVLPSNVASFDLGYTDDAGADHLLKSVSNTQVDKGFSPRVTIVLDEACEARSLWINNIKAERGPSMWNGVAVAEFEAYSDPQKPPVEHLNRVRDAKMEATTSEVERRGPIFAGDGDVRTWWSSGVKVPESNVTLTAKFPEVTPVKQVNVTFEDRAVEVRPSNVESFDVGYTDSAGAEHLLKSIVNTASGQGFSTHATIVLDEVCEARAIWLRNFKVKEGPTSWNGVAVAEFEAYSTKQDAPAPTLDSVIEGLGAATIEADQSICPLPAVPEGFSIKLNGADFEQIIGDDLTVVHPLTDKTVKVSWVVTEDSTGETRKTGDLDYLVRGQHTQPATGNPKPVVVPEIQEWFANSSSSLTAESLESVRYSDPALADIAAEFAADYQAITGRKLAVQAGAPAANAINLTLGAPQTDPLLGQEGYTMQIDSDRIGIVSPGTTGAMYGLQTLLQMSRQNAQAFVQGEMRDYPRFPIRGFMWDVARKPVSLEMMKTVARTMRYYKMNDFQVHLSDNYIFLENYASEEEAWKAYSAFRLETSVANAAGETPTAKDYALSKEQMRTFIQDERAVGMNIVPEIDMPAHAVAFTRIWPELAVSGQGLSINQRRYAIDHFNVENPDAVAKIKQIFDDFTGGGTPTFDAKTTVHLGADEFLISGKADVYRQYINQIIPHVKRTNPVRIWGGLTWLNGPTEISREAIDGVQMNLWSRDWADGRAMFDMGYGLINTIDTYGYMVPSGNGSRGAYGDYLNIHAVFRDFAPERVSTKSGWQMLPSGDKQMLGAAFAIWNDNVDKSASGLTESDEYLRFMDALPVYAEKNWAATGKEKGSADLLRTTAEKTGAAPRVNPLDQVDLKGESYLSLTFDDGLGDASSNGRNYAPGENAAVKNGKLQLNGGSSFIKAEGGDALTRLGVGNALLFTVKLTAPARPGDILFEADAPYGTHDIRIMDDGRLGFTRELYEYYFDYRLPVGERVTIRIENQLQHTELYVNGESKGEAVGRFVDQGIVKKEGIPNSTFVLPLERIGSRTNAIRALVDNVDVRPASSPQPEVPEDNDPTPTPGGDVTPEPEPDPTPDPAPEPEPTPDPTPEPDPGDDVTPEPTPGPTPGTDAPHDGTSTTDGASTDASKDAGKKTDGHTSKNAGKASSKNSTALPQTDDPTHIAVTLVAAAGLAVLASGLWVAHRRRRR